MALKEEFAAAIGTAGNKQSTFRTYWAHVSAFICFVSKQKQEWTHPKDIGHEWIKPFLTEMYATKGTAAKTRNQALSALKFLYENLLKNPIDDDLCKGLRAKQSKYARRILIGKPDLAKLLQEPDTYFYVCGLKDMEEGVLLALSEIAEQAGLISDLGMLVTSLTLEALQKLDTLQKAVPISINIASEHFLEPTFEQEITRLLSSYPSHEKLNGSFLNSSNIKISKSKSETERAM